MEDCRWDFVEWLGPDASTSVLLRLDDPADLVSAGSVSRSWRRLVIANGFFKKLCLKKFPEVSNFICVIEVSSSTETETIEVGSSTTAEWESQEREHKVYSYLSHCLVSPMAKRDCILEPIGASSTDRYPDERIENTLEPSNGVNNRWRYWSSKGESDPGVPETLTYRLTSKLCIVDEIKIKPFKVFFHYGFPIYSAKTVRFRMGHYSVLQGAGTWVYVSPEFPMVQEDVLQSFKLPRPFLCIGGIVQIELLGRVEKCNIDDLYYICVSRVQVIGLPVSPVFEADILGTAGDSILRYFPDARGRDSLTGALEHEDGESSSSWRVPGEREQSHQIRSVSFGTESVANADDTRS